MRSMRRFLWLSMLVLAACRSASVVQSDSSYVQPSSLEEAWTAAGVFASPESAVYDARRELIYVSNVAGYERNGLGYISALSIDGDVVEARWLDNINAPTGMAIDGDTLYAADFDRLLEIDIPGRSILRSYPAPDDNPGLNDVVFSPDGDVFVSASAIGAVYRLDNGILETWARADELEYANGIAATNEGLLVAAFRLYAISADTREASLEPSTAKIEDLESIEPDDGGGFFLTTIGERPIFHILPAGEMRVLLERDVYSADVEFVESLHLLVVPSGGDTVTAFTVH